jgi:predicted membrane-bound spermidine synthase
MTVMVNRRNKSRNITRKEPSSEPANWETKILHNIQWDGNEAIINLYTSDRHIYITRNRGAHDFQGTFGVIISDGATPAITNHGKLYSPPFYESSYRSVAHGIRAGLTMLKHSSKTLNVEIP